MVMNFIGFIHFFINFLSSIHQTGYYLSWLLMAQILGLITKVFPFVGRWINHRNLHFWALKNLLGLDFFWNTGFRGAGNETFSSRLGRAYLMGPKWWVWPFIIGVNLLFMIFAWQKNHVVESIDSRYYQKDGDFVRHMQPPGEKLSFIRGMK